MPPYTAAYGYGHGEALSERDVTGGEEYGTEVTGVDGMGVPDGQGWEVWDEEMGEEAAEDEVLNEDDIEDWSD